MNLSVPTAAVFAGDTFLGTAVHLGEGNFLTCWHVVDAVKSRDRRLRIRFAADQFAGANVIESNPDLDLTVIRVEGLRAPVFSAALWAEGMKWERETPLATALAFGFPGDSHGRSREFAPREVTVSRCDETTRRVLEYAMPDGVPDGCSGGPLIVDSGSAWLTLGVMQLGRRGTARSVARASDPIIEWLRSHQLPCAVRRAPTGLEWRRWPDKPEWLGQYAGKLAANLGSTPAQSVGTGTKSSRGRRMLLRDVYVDLVAERREPKESASSSEEDWEITLAQAVAAARRAVVLGLPGSGKSSFLGQFALELIGQSGGVRPDGGVIPTPMLIALKPLASRLPESKGPHDADPPLLREAIEEALRCAHAEAAIEDVLRGLRLGRVILLLDGLDEVPEPKRARMRDLILDLSQTYPVAPIVVTCRVRTYALTDCQLEMFERIEVKPLTPEQKRQFVRLHFERASSDEVQLVKPEDATPLASSLIETIESREALGEMASTPLMLRFIAEVHARRRLPDNRTELYNELVKELIADLGKVGEDGHGEILARLREVEARDIDLMQLLARLAFAVHENEIKRGTKDEQMEKGLLSKETVRNELQVELGDPSKGRSPKWARQLCQAIEERAGLLISVDDHSFKFPHRSFQEYFAGYHLSQDEEFASKAAILLRSGEHWNEVVGFASGCLMANPKGVRDISDMIREMLDKLDLTAGHPDRALIAAAGIAAEIEPFRFPATTRGDRCLEELTQALLDGFKDGSIPARARVAYGSALGWLGDPRLGVGTERVTVGSEEIAIPRCTWCRIDPGPFTMGADVGYDDEKPAFDCPFIIQGYWMATYPVTVVQYEAFLRATHHSGPERYSRVFSTPNHPQVGVTWGDAMAFCHWMSDVLARLSPEQRARLEIPPGDWEVRLPDEWEWERSARGTGEAQVSLGKRRCHGGTFERSSGTPAHVSGGLLPPRQGALRRFWICLETFGSGVEASVSITETLSPSLWVRMTADFHWCCRRFDLLIRPRTV